MGYERETSARQKALDLVKKRDALEAEMDSIIELLHSNNGPGLTGNLIDAEGFPRSDIDIHAIRTQRQRFARLKTDHKLLSEEIEKNLHIALAPPSEPTSAAPTTPAVHSSPTRPASAPSTQPPATAPPTSNGVQSAPSQGAVSQRRPPFALVDIVAPESPAYTAGLKVGDRIVAVGAVSLRAFPTPRETMAALPGLLSQHVNQSVDVIVEREGGQVVTLALVPKRWSGTGVLGCHVVPLEVSQEDAVYRPDVATATAERQVTRQV
eukprot:GFKZ01007951.1.p1 GENE.GFKZ01007951.1~~GFKZ01007951.1.p1  ORF type:complete len:266 (+),score=32.44 GFKZ01007951.1:156-953(+)